MTKHEDFISQCSRLDFDPAAKSQARVWQKINSPVSTKLFWRKAVAWGACVLFFAIGFGTSVLFSARHLQTPYATTYAKEAQPAPEADLWICVLDKTSSHPSGCRCWQHRAENAAVMQTALQQTAAGELPHCQVQPQPVQQCEQNVHPGVASFYDFCEEC